jgi:hypothetical protein
MGGGGGNEGATKPTSRIKISAGNRIFERIEPTHPILVYDFSTRRDLAY